MDTKDAYNLIAEDWHKDHQSDDWWIEGTNKFISLLPPGASVLDIGCGAGTKASYLKARGLDVMGIDASENLLKIARREVPDVEFQVMDLRDLHALDRTFDALFLQAVLLHIPKRDVQACVQGMLPRVKDNGYVYIAVKEIRPGQSEEETIQENDYGYTYERFFSYFTQEEVGSLMKACGLEIVYSNVSPAGKTRWIQVIGKKM